MITSSFFAFRLRKIDTKASKCILIVLEQSLAFYHLQLPSNPYIDGIMGYIFLPKLPCKEGGGAKLIAALEPMYAQAAKENNSTYFAYVSEKDADEVRLFEEYASKADCDKHFKTDDFKKFGALLVGELLKSDPQLDYYEPEMGFLGRGDQAAVAKGKFVWLAEFKCHDAAGRESICAAATDLIRYVYENVCLSLIFDYVLTKGTIDAGLSRHKVGG
jgi:quinol monooxygenase YgiN